MRELLDRMDSAEMTLRVALEAERSKGTHDG
jgi:hypothetical protein